MTAEEKAAADKAAADKATADAAEKVEFSDKQQAKIGELFDARFAKIQAKHEEEKRKLKKELDDAKAAAEANKNETDAEKAAREAAAKGDEDPAKKQTRELIETEKRNTVAAKLAAKKAEDEGKSLREENARILKMQAIREAASDRFLDMEVVLAITQNKIEFDPDTKTYVVRENGVIRQNSSLENLSLADYFTDFASKRPYLAKSNTKGGAGSRENDGGKGSNGMPNTKADLKTIKAKSDFIAEHGLKAFEDLPLKPATA